MNKEKSQKAILLLHGSRQTGELLLGRMTKLRSKLLKQHNIKLVSMDAPFRHTCSSSGSSEAQRTELTWWTYNNNHSDDNVKDKVEYRCEGLVESLQKVHAVWQHAHEEKGYIYEGIIGFSQGARLAHYIAAIHSKNNDTNDGSLFPGLQYVMLCAGYDDPMPSQD